jgi:RHS repeat-associated protein
VGNILNVVTDRKLIQAPVSETVFDDKFNTPGDLLGWHYDPVLAQEPVPSGYSLTNPSGKLVVNPGSASSYGSVIKSVQFLQGVHYTLSFDAVLSTNQGAVLAGSSSGTLLIADFLTTGSHSFNFVGDGSFGYIAFLMLPNVVYQYDNIKLVANDVQTVTADVKTYSDYYPYGMQLPKRHGEDVYRYGYQGSERDDEVKGSGNSYTTEFRQLDPRLGRWLSIDPVFQSWESPYVSMGNNPIWRNDVSGDVFDEKSQEKINTHKAETNTKLTEYNNQIKTLETEKQEKGELSKRKQGQLDYLKQASSELTDAIREIDVLEKSSQKYTLSIDFTAAQNGGLTSYNPNTDVITIGYDGTTSTLAHELKHGYQFEVHEISFTGNGLEDTKWGVGFLGDLSDERAAFIRGFAYSQTAADYPQKGLFATKFTDITNAYVAQIGYTMIDFPGGISGSTNAYDALDAQYKKRGLVVDLSDSLKAMTMLEVIRAKNEKELWEKIK